MKKVLSALLSASVFLFQFNGVSAIESSPQFPYVQNFDNTGEVESTWKFTGLHGYGDDENSGKSLMLYPQKNSGYNASYHFKDVVKSGLLKISYSMKAGDCARHIMYVISSENKQYPIMSVIPPGKAVSGYASDAYAECIITNDFVCLILVLNFKVRIQIT